MARSELSLFLTSSMAPPQQRSGYVKCYSCSYAWNWKTKQTCYWCGKALAPWTDAPPPVQGAWAARVSAAAQAEAKCTQQSSPEGGWEPWSSWPKSRRRRGKGNGKDQDDDWWASKNDTPKARSAEDILAELQAIAPHIDKAAIDGIKSQIPPPQPQKPADLNDIYSRAQATERRCKNNLERLLESEQKALSWYTERKQGETGRLPSETTIYDNPPIINTMDAVLDPFDELAELDAHIDFAVSEQYATAPPETLSSVGGDEAAQTVDPVAWDPGQPQRTTRSDPDAAPPETLSSVGSDETAQAVDVHAVQEPGEPSPKANPDAAPPKTQSMVGGDEMAKAVDTPAGKGPWKPSSPRADPSPAYQDEGPTKPPLSDHSLFFSNITQWGPQSEKWLAGPGKQYQMVALVETHISPGKAPPIYDKLAADGWRISSTTATPTSRSDGGNTGGEIILSRYQVQATTFNHLRDLAISQRRPDPFLGFTPMVWHRRSGNLVVIAAHLEPHRQIEGAVHDKLLSLGAFVTMLTDPWIILADWNMTPEQLAATEWLAKWNATIVRAPGSATCDKGQGLTLDFALVKTGIEHTISIRQCPTVPWATHVGLEVRAGSADPWWYQSIDTPKSFPIVIRPRIPPDPNSKTAIKKRKTAEARAARLRDLPPELQQAAAQLQPQDEPAAQEPIPYAIPMDSWEKQWQEAAPTRCKQPHAHFVYRHWVHDADVLNLKYAKWVTALENTMISHHQIDPKEAAAYTGRAQGYQLSWKKTAAAPGRVHVHDSHSEWWAITLTLIKRYAALHDQPKHTALMQQQATIIQQRADHFNTHMHDLQFEKDEDTIFRWFALVWAPHLGKDDTDDLVTITATWASRALSAALAKSKRAYGAWLAQQWKHRPGVLHAHVKPAPARHIEAYTANLTIADLTVIMDNKKQQWQQVWQATETSDDILQAPSKAKAAVAHQPLEPITAEIVHRIHGRMPPSKAHGVDALGADMVTIRIEQRRFLANGDFSDWALNNTIISGGQWTRDRLHNAGYQIDRNCDRCSAGVPETLFHRMWQCEANAGPEFEASDKLLPRALAGADADPALWLRGIPSVALTTPTFEPLTGRDGWEFVGAVREGLPSWEGARNAEGELFLFGDGSGGAFSDDVRPDLTDPIQAGGMGPSAHDVHQTMSSALAARLEGIHELPDGVLLACRDKRGAWGDPRTATSRIATAAASGSTSPPPYGTPGALAATGTASSRTPRGTGGTTWRSSASACEGESTLTDYDGIYDLRSCKTAEVQRGL
ncbi:unnamed protein product [Prorocentrum cordatum]|uniref:Uncharacterized protein n=1 Tax=Prorocentrum cordatum TaxID=2364126 RepID=A0ABN9VSC0_9DINO|nr:unnamed protein product [Polarella glacialis]